MAQPTPAPASPSLRERLIDTTRGPVPHTALGRVLMHQHLFCRVRPEHQAAAKRFVADRLEEIAAQGVRTVVDLTTYVLPEPFLDALAHVPINVICCAGYCLQKRVPAAYHSLDAAALATKLRAKIETGIGKSRVKPGIIKVASGGRTFTRFERNALPAAGIVQREIGLPVATHACMGGRQQLEVLIAEGANPRKVFLSHVEMELKGSHAREFDPVAADVLWVLEQGAYVFFGDFSVQDTAYRRQVIRLVRLCHERGFGRQLFISTDSYWTHRRGGFALRGGIGSRFPRTYNYAFTVIVPLLKRHGFTDQDVVLWLERNPADFFRQAAK